MENPSSQCEPLIPEQGSRSTETADAFTDLKGRPVCKSSTGGWPAALLIILFEIAERAAFYGIESNLITYLTQILHVSTASAAVGFNNWSGAASILPIFGAYLADSCLGRYWAVTWSSVLYILGMFSLTLSAFLPLFRPATCYSDLDSCPRATDFQLGFFYLSIYMIVLGIAGHKPCLQAFGADQFDNHDKKELKNKGSFFNWWYFGMCSGTLLSLNAVTYIQENLSWGVGFGIPTMLIMVGFGIFLLGTNRYRHLLPKTSPFTEFVKVFVSAFRKRRVSVLSRKEQNIFLTHEEESGLSNEVGGELLLRNHFRFLDKAAIILDDEDSVSDKSRWIYCSPKEVEDVKLILRLFPIWACCFMYGVVFNLPPTFFTKQGKTMQRKIGSDFEVPAATLQSFTTLSVVVIVPLYDRIFVPLMRKITGSEYGITQLQRIGIGLFLSIVCMTIAALTEMKRLQVVNEFGLEDQPNATVPMNICWLLPQYLIIGAAHVFTMVGMQEFFYDQISNTMRSMGMALYLSAIGVGSFLCSLLITFLNKLSTTNGGRSWFDNNTNRAHIDYFYWVIAVLSTISFSIYVACSMRFIYK